MSVTISVSARDAVGAIATTTTVATIGAVPICTPINFTLPTNPPATTIIGSVSATNTPTSFSIVSGNSQGYFAIGQHHTKIVPAVIPPDGVYALTVAATNAVGTGPAVPVNITVGGAIKLVPATFTPHLPVVSGQVMGTAAHTGGTPDSWAITEGDPKGFFSIDKNGVIRVTVAGAADTTATIYNLTCQATNFFGAVSGMWRVGPLATPVGNQIDNGWTNFVPTAPVTTGSTSPGSGTMQIYVANAGNDSTGDGTQANPYKTIKKGSSFLRQGFDDWLLLKSGDTFTNDFFTFVSGSIGNAPPGGSGMTVNPPWLTEGAHTVTGVQLITSYGAGSSPIIQWDSQNAGVINGGGYVYVGNHANTFNNVAWLNLDFYAYTRDNGNAFQTANPSYSATAAANGSAAAFFSTGHTNNWIFEGNRFRFANAFGYQGDTSVQPPVLSMTNFIFRRNTAMYNYPGSSLFFSGVTNILIEENILNNCGWYDPGSALQNERNHNIYCFSNTFNVTVRHNIYCADYGGFKLDSGGTVYDNYFAYVSPTQTGAQGDTQGTGYILTTTYNVIQHASDGTEGTAVGVGEGLKLYPSVPGSILDHNIISLNNSASPNLMFSVAYLGADHWATATASSGSNSLTVTDPGWNTGDSKSPWYWQPGLVVQNAALPAGTVVVSASGWTVNNTGTVIVSNNTTGTLSGTLTVPMTGATATNNISYGYSVATPGTNGIADGGVGTILNGNVYLPSGGGGYPLPNRSIETYATDVLGRSTIAGSDARGISNQFQEVMQLVYFNQTKANWDVRLTAKVLNNYIRFGFNYPQL